MTEQPVESKQLTNLQRFFVPEGAPELCRALASRRSLLRWSLLSELAAANPGDDAAVFLTAELQTLTPLHRHEVLGSPDFGVLIRSRMSGRAAPAAELAVLGAVASHRAPTSDTLTFRVQGELRLVRQPVGRWIVVGDGEIFYNVRFAVAGDTIEITGGTNAGANQTFRLAGSAGLAQAALRSATGGNIWEITDGWQCYLDTFEDGNTSLEFSNAERTTLRGILDQVVELVRKIAPGVVEEMAETACYLSPIAPLQPDAGIPSFSSPDFPGVIFVGTHDCRRCPLDWRHLVESCVHEHLHNRLYLLETAQPLTVARERDTPARTYHSPWKRRGRPIDGMMHAIYVFAYLAWFWDKVRQSDEPAPLRDFAHARCEEQREAVSGALKAVEGTDELTAAGAEVIAASKRLAEQLAFV